MNDRPANLEKPVAPEAAAVPAGAPQHPFAPPRRSRLFGVVFRLFILLLVAGLILVVAEEWDWWVGSAVLQSTDDAYLHADLTPLAAKVPGYVRRVNVADFQRVKAGEVLVEIVDDDYRAELDQAEANVAAAEAAIQNIEQQKLLQAALIQQAEATIQAAEADVTRYHLEAVRQQTLLTGGLAGTRQLVEQADDNEKLVERSMRISRTALSCLDEKEEQREVAARRKAQIDPGPVIGEHLTTVQGYRAMEVGSVLVWIALPQFVLAPLTGSLEATKPLVHSHRRIRLDHIAQRG